MDTDPTPAELAYELRRAIRRSEPDAREVYGVVRGRRWVWRRDGEGAEWVGSQEDRPTQGTER